jgi:type II secretory pathway pseudopilin PulG
MRLRSSARLRPLSREQGFTLIELIVGAVALTGIVVASFLSLRAGLEASDLVDERAELLQRARAALDLIASDLRSAVPLSKDHEFVGLDRQSGVAESDSMVFATRNYRPMRPGEADFCEVTYLVMRDPATGRRSLYRRRDPSPDEEPFQGGSRELIIADVAELSFEFQDGFKWYPTWGRTWEDVALGREPRDLLARNVDGLPDAVRITISVALPGTTVGSAGGDAPAATSRPSRSIPKAAPRRKPLASGASSRPASSAIDPGDATDRVDSTTPAIGDLSLRTVVRLGLAPISIGAPQSSSSSAASSSASGGAGGGTNGTSTSSTNGASSVPGHGAR